jgi:hypothetical protein
MSRPSRFALLRDHQPARRLAHRLERADAATAAEDRRALLTYWYGAGASHLRAETHVLSAAWDRHGGAGHPLNASVRGELERLSRRVGAVAADPLTPAQELRGIGRDLLAHLNRQEHELYGAVEHTLEPDELSEVEAALEDLRRF